MATMSKRSLASLAKVLSTSYTHAALSHLFMLFELDDQSAPGTNKLQRAMDVVTASEKDPILLAHLILLAQHAVEDLDLVGRRDRDQISGDGLILLTSLEKDGVLTAGPCAAAQQGVEQHPTSPTRGSTQRWDAFISHASEDKGGLVADLAKELSNRGLRIWYDDDVLQVGDSVRAAIDHGLSASDFGIVVISHDYMRKDWTNHELDGILALERGKKRLLPVWHGVTYDEVVKYSATVAGRHAVRSSIGVQGVADALSRSMGRGITEDGESAGTEMAPGRRFLSLLNQQANSRAYAWVIVGGELETAAKFSEDEIETFVGWLSSFEAGAVTTQANSAFVRVVATDPVEKATGDWIGEAHHGPVINLLTSLELTLVGGRPGVTISLEALAGWWASIVEALPTLAGNLGLKRVRLGFGLYPYGPNSIPVVGVDFGAAPIATLRAEYHSIPPWHSYTELFDPFEPPSTILQGPVRDLLDTFSYGRADETVSWVARGLADGSLKMGYTGHAISRGALEASAREQIARIMEARLNSVENLNSQELGVLVGWAHRAAGQDFTLTYPISGNDGSAYMLAAEGWNAEQIHSDRTRHSLAEIARKHAEVVADVRAWDVWRRLKSLPP
jgi:hypothetical protein